MSKIVVVFILQILAMVGWTFIVTAILSKEAALIMSLLGYAGISYFAYEVNVALLKKKRFEREQMEDFLK